jgi:hypothetical protein
LRIIISIYVHGILTWGLIGRCNSLNILQLRMMCREGEVTVAYIQLLLTWNAKPGEIRYTKTGYNQNPAKTLYYLTKAWVQLTIS